MGGACCRPTAFDEPVATPTKPHHAPPGVPSLQMAGSGGVKWNEEVMDHSGHGGAAAGGGGGDHDHSVHGMKSTRNLLQILLNEYPDFHERMYEIYPSAVLAKEFIKSTGSRLNTLGFTRQNSIACICLCRDEACQHFFNDVQKQWCTRSDLGAFNMSSLAGIINIGKTGLKAAESHAPNRDGMERYVYYGFTHIAIGEGGEIGVCIRPGRAELSHACGALLAVQGRYKNGDFLRGRPAMDLDDVEASLVCQAIYDRLGHGAPNEVYVPTLEAITRAACEEISDRFARLIELTTKDRACNYALFTGVQIHGPDGHDYVFPHASYAVVDGRRHEIEVDARRTFARSKSRAGSPRRATGPTPTIGGEVSVHGDLRVTDLSVETPSGAGEDNEVRSFSPDREA